MLYGAIIAGVVNAVGDTLGAIQKNSALDRAAPQAVKLGEFQDSFKDYISQADNLPAVTQLLSNAADQDNERYIKGLERYFPGIASQLKQQGERALSYQQGYISPDQQLDIKRKQAYRALQGGYQGSQMADQQQEVATARAAIANQQYGNQLASQTAQIARALSPDQINVAGTILSPQDLLKRQDANVYYNTDMGNQTRAASAGLQLAGSKQFAEAATKGFSGLGAYFGGNSSFGGNGASGGGGGGNYGWSGQGSGLGGSDSGSSWGSSDSGGWG